MLNPRTILVVDDEPGVLDITVSALTLDGFNVIEAANPDRALAILAERADVDLLLTDVLMPGTTGYELARRAKALRPALKVLYTSGYDSGPHKNDHGAKFGPVLWKPYRIDQLVSEVKAALETR